MTQSEEEATVSESADMVQIAFGEDHSAVDEIEDVVDKMLPIDDSTSGSEAPSTYPHADALADLELEADESDPEPDGDSVEDPEIADDPSSDTGTEQGKSRSVTTEELDELMLDGLGPVEQEAVRIVDEIARITEAFETMRDSAIVEIQAGMAAGTSQRVGLSESLDSILQEFRAVRQEMIETGRVAQDSIDAAQRADHRVRDLGDRFLLAGQVRREVEPLAKPIFDVSFAYLGGAVILLSWAVAFWIRTGDLTIAMSGVVLANLAACGMLLSARRAE